MGSYDLFGPKGFKVVKHFNLRYASGEALEPFYYRILYALRNNRQYQVIKKILDYYNVSPNSQQFGFATQNLRQEISSASGLLGQVGQVVKSLVAMRKDKQRIDECLRYYDETGKPNELVLKGIWADFVDSKTGPASLTQAAQKLEFFVARDWFFKAGSLKEIENLKPGDVPNNLKDFLLRKYKEYEVWKKEWKPRLLDMKRILDSQLKASSQTINLYKQWVQPLLKNVEALKMAPDPLNPDLLKVSGGTYSQVELVAWHKLDLKNGSIVNFTYEPAKNDKDLTKPFGERGVCKFRGKSVPFMPLLYFTLTLRLGSKGYMETVVNFEGRVYDKKKFEELYYDVWVNDPAEKWIKNLMLKEELKLEEPKKKVESKPVNEDVISDLFNSFKNLPDSFKKFSESLAKFKKKLSFNSGSNGLTKYQLDNLIGSASGELGKDVALVYFVVKKSFRMLAELEMFM